MRSHPRNSIRDKPIHLTYNKRQLLLLVFVIYNFTMQFATLIATTTETHISPLNYLLIQWRIQGQGGRGDWGAEGPKKCFGRPPPPPYLKVWNRHCNLLSNELLNEKCNFNVTIQMRRGSGGRLMHAVSIQ